MRISDWSSDVCSSDLADQKAPSPPCAERGDGGSCLCLCLCLLLPEGALPPSPAGGAAIAVFGVFRADSGRVVRRLRPGCGGDVRLRSAEHTSELQSLMRISYAVFCLKKKPPQTHITTTYR